MSEKKSYRSGFASLLGRANVGKSTLLNQLVGQKVAIVSNVPQTTRHRIIGVRTMEAGQVAFVDTPGFHRPKHHLGQVMLERAREAAEEADVLLFVIDASEGIGPGDRYVLEQIDPRSRKGPVLLVLNKLDQMNKGKTLPMIHTGIEEWGCTEVVPVSAREGVNCDRLLDRILSHLPEGPQLFPDDYVTDQRERMIAAEIVREKLLARTWQEVPHAIAVGVEQFEVRDDGLLEIAAMVIVERDSQKGIVIGRGGSMLKLIGTQARKELETRFKRKVFLRLFVKVRAGWRDRVNDLRDLGIYP